MKTQSLTHQSPDADARNAGFQSSVSRISNPQALLSDNELPTASRRYGRVQLCARAASAFAIVLALQLGALSASALQTAATQPGPAPAKAPAPNAASSHPNLTSAAPVASRNPASSAEDIRDIRQPRHLPTPLAWVAVAAGVMLLSAAAFAAWRWLRRGKLLSLTPCAAALQQLEAARRLMDPEHAREYCFAASQIIRNYVERQFHVQAPRLTTEEFLRDLVEVRETMLASHRELLGDFLQHCDLAKFAGWRYSLPALEHMHNTAVNFVRQSATPEAHGKQVVPATPQSRAGVSPAQATEDQPTRGRRDACPTLSPAVLPGGAQR